MNKKEEFNFGDYDHKSMSEFLALDLLNGYSHLFETKDRIIAEQLYDILVKKYNDELFARKR